MNWKNQTNDSGKKVWWKNGANDANDGAAPFNLDAVVEPHMI